MYDIIIVNGLLVDGTGEKSKYLDVAVKNGRIAGMGSFAKKESRRFIDAKSKVVCPGFIDCHAHSDYFPLLDSSSASKVHQGVTTEISGNCGVSPFPLVGRAEAKAFDEMKPLGLKVDWRHFREYKQKITKSGMAINHAYLLGLNTLRTAVVGFDDRPPTRTEMEKMKKLIRAEISAGAIGLSSGLIYPPGCFYKTEDLIELCKSASDFNVIYTSHIRSESDKLLESIEETIRIGGESGLRVQISHLKTSGKRNWKKINKALTLIKSAIKRGVRITADRYPYTASSTDLDAILPNWTYDGGKEAEIRRLKDEETLARIRKEMRESKRFGGLWNTIMIASAKKHRGYEGRMISDIIKEKNADGFDFIIDLLLEEDLNVSAIYFSMKEDNLRKIMKQPFVMVGSDSTARALSGITRGGKPHPRGFGTFPRVIDRFVRQEKILSLESAVYKMTGMPATVFGLKNRGELHEGYFADIVVFDLENIKDKATFTEPYQYAEGIDAVIVNGETVLKNGKMTGRLPGRVLMRDGK